MNARKVSILSALAASSCCVLPLILLGMTLLGIGTAGMAGLSSTLGALKWYIMPFAIMGLATSYYLFFKEKKKCEGTACKMANATFTKTMLTISTLVVSGFLTWSVYPYILSTAPIQTDSNSSTHLAVFEIDGMTCGACEISIDVAIGATEIVDSVKSSFMDGKAYVWYSDDDIDMSRIEEAIKSVGYKPLLLKVN